MRSQKNAAIRDEIRSALLCNYEIAERIGISSSMFYTRLQRDLTAAQEKEIRDAIRELKEKRQKDKSVGG